MRPKKVLCKKGYTLGNDYQYIGFNKVKVDNRVLIEGQWYDTVYNKNDDDNTFTIIDNHGDKNLYIIYDSDEYFLARNYAEWFFTIDEMRDMKINKILYDS